MARDLIILAADRETKSAVDALLRRHEALGIRQIDFESFAHPQHDPGCLNRSERLLGPYSGDYDYALVLFDRDGSGRENSSRHELEHEVASRLAATGWLGRSEVIVIDPELEAWVWSDSPHVDRILGWHGRTPALDDWLVQEGFKAPETAKPADPKRALLEALWKSRKPRSSALYRQLAENVSLARCTDPSFDKFKRTVQAWFGS